MRLDEQPLVMRSSRRISKSSSCRRMISHMPVFKLETHNQTNYGCLSQLVQTDNAFPSIKMANVSNRILTRHFQCYMCNPAVIQGPSILLAVYPKERRKRSINAALNNTITKTEKVEICCIIDPA